MRNASHNQKNTHRMRVCSTPKTNNQSSKRLRQTPRHASVLRISRFDCLSLEPDKQDLGEYVSRVVISIKHSAVTSSRRSRAWHTADGAIRRQKPSVSDVADSGARAFNPRPDELRR
jgi:hypothetical protein